MNHIPTEMRGEKATEVADFKDRVRTGLFVLGGETVMKERFSLSAQWVVINSIE